MSAEWAEPVWHLFVVRHPRRDALQARLSEAGVDTIIHYPIPPHRTGAYAGGFDGVRLPVAERLADEVLSLPMGPHLALEDADAVAGAVREAVGALRGGVPSHERARPRRASSASATGGRTSPASPSSTRTPSSCGAATAARRRSSCPKRRYPQVGRTTDFQDVLDDDSVEAVVIATPTATHADLAVAALEAGKHVLVEKPLAASSEEIDRIEAARGDRVVMVGHTFVYNSAIAAIRDLVASGELGRIQYVDSVRAALGPIRQDVNALWDLGAHDASIFLDVLPGRPSVVTAIAQDYLREGHPDVVYFAVRFDDGVLAHSHVSWLDPYKVRRVTVVGEDRMAVFDDVAHDERLKILERGASYDAPAQEARGQSFGEYRAVLREGTITIPRLPGREPLSTQFQEFLDAVREGREPYSGIAQARDVVRVLEAAQRSLENGGAPEQLGAVSPLKAG